jgi:hypothetical protein
MTLLDDAHESYDEQQYERAGCAALISIAESLRMLAEIEAHRMSMYDEGEPDPEMFGGRFDFGGYGSAVLGRDGRYHPVESTPPL